MKKYRKILKIVFVMICMLNVLCGYCHATEDGPADGIVKQVTGPIITALRVIGVSIAIIILLRLAIQYMTSSPSGKADVVKTAIPFATGAIVLFSAGAILRAIAKLIS